MKQQEKFDDIIRQKFAEKEFLFNEENWEKAEKMIDSAARIKSIVKWSAVFSVGIFIGAALMLPFVVKMNDESTKKISQSEINKKDFREEKIITKSDDYQQTENIIQPETKEENLQEAKMVFSDKINKKIHSAEKENLQQTKMVFSDKPNQKIHSAEKENKISKDESNMLANEISFPKNQSVKDDLKNNKQTNTFLQNTSGKSDNTEKNLQENISLAPITNQALQVDALSVTNINQQSDNIKSETNSSSVVSQNNSAELPLIQSKGLASATIFSIDAGTDFALGWSYNDTIEARGFNPVFGIGITHYFNPQWVLYSGIQYGSIAHLAMSKKTFSTKIFEFGCSTIDTVIDTKLLYYVVFPLQLQYHFNYKNSIGIGGSVSYLVNTKSNVYNKTDMIQKTKTGYYVGAFNQWDVALSLSYRRTFSEKFSVSVLANYGLFDIKENSFFAREKFERNIGLKILFSYNLF
ncbi:MAG: hypothetical protein V1781_06325 [Bacteroidota bacterium]